MSPNTATTGGSRRKTNAELQVELDRANANISGLLDLIAAFHTVACSAPEAAKREDEYRELIRAHSMLGTVKAFSNTADGELLIDPPSLRIYADVVRQSAAQPLNYVPRSDDNGGWISGACATTGEAEIEVRP